MPLANLDRHATEALTRAVRHAVATQRADGSWEAPADPRIFDTALCAFSLAEQEPGGRTVARARRWLAAARPQVHDPWVHSVERALRGLAMSGPSPSAFSALTAEMARYPNRTLLLRTVAVAAGCPDVDPNDHADTLAAAFVGAAGRPMRPWQRVNLAAMTIVAGHAAGRAVSPEALAVLLAEQAPDGSFCLMPTVAAAAYLALTRAAPRSSATARCRDYLLRSQASDGTWRFVPSDIWDTTLMIRSLRGVPEFDSPCLDAAASFVEESQSADGGWACKTGLDSDNDTTGAALLALARTGQGRRVWPRAARYARRVQLEDGLWRTWQSFDDPPAQDVVAHLVCGLAAHDPSMVDTTRARRWLRRCGERDGGLRADWYSPSSYAVAEVVPAIGWPHPSAVAALDQLAGEQLADGGWPGHPGDATSSAAATGLAVTALCDGDGRHLDRIGRGLRYLIECQNTAGGWPGTPIMYGPRPFLAHFPTHTHAFATAGLINGARRLSAPAPVVTARTA